jgi:hypothetical protein
MTITIQSTVKNGKSPAYAFNSQFAGLCQFPLHQIMATLTLGFNNASITIRPSQIFPALLQYWIDREQQKSVMSTTPCYPDQTNTYGQLDGEITSEFADYTSSVDHISRNCNATMNFSQNGQLKADGASGTAVINVTLSEPLMISPLVFSDIWHHRAGITQINNLNIQITYDPQALQNRLLPQSPNDYVNLTSINVQLGQPSVGLWYYTMPSYMKITETISYPYAQITNFIYSDGTTITSSTPKFQMTSASVQLQSIPHLMYVNVRKLASTLTVNDPDFSIPITGINLTWTTNLVSCLR